ncbi:MAG TPA: thiopeptide-type bacteriocin biosynthesis protein [Ktedonobacteraceae bacterium]|nr:thiopeptide-type bacteriocin biosynthesis protein [Ktedonobacteraceae bacterium]
MKQEWVSLHLFYHDDPVPLLTECVQPAIKELYARHLLQRCFFIRYWQGGPHIRLRLLPRSEAVRETLLELVATRIAAFFTAHPAQSQMREEEYFALRTRFGMAEYGEPDFTPLYPNNALQYIAYEPEYERYGGTAAMPLVEQHFTESSEIALTLLQEKPSRNQLSGHALATLFLGFWLCEDDFNALPGIFEDYYDWWSSGYKLDTHFGRLYQRQHENVRKLIRRLRSLKQDIGAIPDAQEYPSEYTMLIPRWISSICTLKAQLQRLAQEQNVEIELRRVLYSCLHMHNNRLGISPVEEAYLAFLLKESLATMISQSSFSVEEAFHK